MKTNFWNNNSHLQPFASRLESLVPIMGAVNNADRNPALEKFRVASCCYYDLFNNGLGNRAREFSRVFKVRIGDYIIRRRYGYPQYNIDALGDAVEQKMERIVLDAYVEQYLSKEESK
jgi:hypothetical protein